MSKLLMKLFSGMSLGLIFRPWKVSTEHITGARTVKYLYGSSER